MRDQVDLALAAREDRVRAVTAAALGTDCMHKFQKWHEIARYKNDTGKGAFNRKWVEMERTCVLCGVIQLRTVTVSLTDKNEMSGTDESKSS